MEGEKMEELRKDFLKIKDEETAFKLGYFKTRIENYLEKLTSLEVMELYNILF